MPCSTNTAEAGRDRLRNRLGGHRRAIAGDCYARRSGRPDPVSYEEYVEAQGQT